MENKKIEFESRIIQHLGKDLITTPDVAIVELLKNSLDAQAKDINLYCFSDFSNIHDVNYQFIKNKIFKCYDEYIQKYSSLPIFMIEDNGNGMSPAELIDNFLKIGTRAKMRERDKNAGTRTILGEKGIGRLSIQRLGKSLLVESVSKEQNNIVSVVYIEWDKLINGEAEVPFQSLVNKKKMKSYTRLWVFDAKLSDYFNFGDNVSLFKNISLIQINNNLLTAINCLILPFKSGNEINIKFYYNNDLLDTKFPKFIIEFSESTHYFQLENLKNGHIAFVYGLLIKPWFLERLHRALVGSDTFRKTRKPHSYYKKLLSKNSDRIANILNKKINDDELQKHFENIYEEIYKSSLDQEAARDSIISISEKDIKNLEKILPISGELFSFKQSPAIAEDIIFDFVKESFKGNKTIAPDTKKDIQEMTISKLKNFLDKYNGVKLYRDIFRIGLLGNKDNDWIKLQQFRTKGQQWFRFDLGNTLGFVSLNDKAQNHIQEISSRLDIMANDVSDSFKVLMEIAFNYLFYELNKSANSIIKIIFQEEGLLTDNIPRRVRKNTDKLDEIARKNKKIQTSIKKIIKDIDKNTVVDKQGAHIPNKTYSKLKNTLDVIEDQFEEYNSLHDETSQILDEANEQLKTIEVEAYNNYKLMANGLITETITHELDSVTKTSVDSKTDDNFDILKKYFMDIDNIKMYNDNVYPIRNSYTIISSKLRDVSNLYNFLEKTFIKKGTYEEFVDENIHETILKVYNNISKFYPLKNIDINIDFQEMIWSLPQGVMLHVFYNMFTNSFYWIDQRRKFATSDKKYFNSEKDIISIYPHGDGIIVQDTGLGVIKHMEDLLFEPLQSGKPLREGRGMGLYIVKKLLQSFGGSIELLAVRNPYGNRYKFLISPPYKEGENTNG
jgi:signal transduction histidine kinase